MLEIVYGRDWKALSRSVRDRIIQDAKMERSGRVLIVPEQYSFESERALCADGGDQISRWAEVLSFSRLADRACTLCGGVARPVLDRGGRIMALAKTVSQVRPQLKFYAKSARRADFLLQMLSIVDELKCYRIDSRALAAASERLEGTLAVKTQELSLLLEGYEAQCADAGPDPRDRLEQLVEHIQSHRFGRNLRLFVEGFFGFTAQELQILGAFLARGTDISVFLCCDDPFEGEQVFSSVRETIRSLMHAADLCHAQIRLTPMKTELPPLTAAALSAFTRQAAAATAGLRMRQCEGPREEAEAICAEILAHVRGGGRFRDIAVACAAPDELRPVLEAEFERCRIPAFFTGKQPALRTSLLNATLCALRAAGGRMEREDVIAYLRSDGAPIDQAQCDLLENYAFLWNISGDMWQTEWTWHPRGYDNDMSDADRNALKQLNRLREKCIAPLCRLRQELRERTKVGECVIAFYDFLLQTEYSRHVSEHLTALELAGEEQQVQVTRQLYDLLINALEQLYSVQYDAACTPEEFLRLMEILLSQYQVGAIPAVLDAVTVGDCAAFEHRQTPVLFLCGCNDGSFPRPASGGSLLTEPDRRRLRDAGIGLAPDENAQMDRNLMGAFALLCAADAQIYLSAGEQSAWLFKTLCTLYPDAVCTELEAPPTIYATEQTLGLALARGARMTDPPTEAQDYCRRLQRAAQYDFGMLTSQTIRSLYGRTVFLSASRIDRFAACRFHFFLRDGLKARERKAAAFDAPIYGTLVHGVFEAVVARVMEEGGFRKVRRERMRDLVRMQLDRQLREIADPMLLASGRFSYLMQRNYDEILRVADVLYDELHESTFAPADCELTFGSGGALPSVQVSSGENDAIVSGAVDRVDLAEIGGELFYRVVDYKTGRKDFDYTDLLERRGLQMLIYLFALERYGAERYGKPIHPAGVLYVPAHDDLLRFSARPEETDETVRARLKSHRRQGLLMNDDILLQAMEPCGEDSPALLPYQRGKQGLKGDLMDTEQLGMLRRYVNRALRSVTDEIMSGNVRPNPYTRGAAGACTWCPYAEVCHLDLCKNEPRVLSATKAEEFWTRLARKEAQHG